MRTNSTFLFYICEEKRKSEEGIVFYTICYPHPIKGTSIKNHAKQIYRIPD